MITMLPIHHAVHDLIYHATHASCYPWSHTSCCPCIMLPMISSIMLLIILPIHHAAHDLIHHCAAHDLIHHAAHNLIHHVATLSFSCFIIQPYAYSFQQTHLKLCHIWYNDSSWTLSLLLRIYPYVLQIKAMVNAADCAFHFHRSSPWQR